MNESNSSENRKLLLFFVIVFSWSWTFWIIAATVQFSIFIVSWPVFTSPISLINILLVFLGTFGPSLGGFFLTYKYEGKEELKKFFKSGFNFKFKKIWLIPIFIILPVLYCIGFLLNILFRGNTSELFLLSTPVLIIPFFFYTFFFGGPFEEEFGWRGYALDRMQANWNSLNSSIILGIIWAIWHLPLFFIPGASQTKIDIFNFFIAVILTSVFITWIYNNTEKNLLTALLVHTVGNVCYNVFMIHYSEFGYLFFNIILFILLVFVVIIYGPKNLKREKKNNI